MINPPAIIHSKVVGVVYKFLTAHKVLIIQTLAIAQKPDGGTRLANPEFVTGETVQFCANGHCPHTWGYPAELQFYG
jgi:hypothetical protein